MRRRPAREAGKSSLVNAVTGQELAIVSDIRGTTTDPVYKSMELLPLGPVVIIDTPGIDDEGELGAQRIAKAQQVLGKCDIALLVVDASVGLSEADKALWQQLQECLESTRLLLGANGRTLCYDLPEENDMVRGDAEMLMRAILHLICNGLDAADDATAPVTVRGSVAGDQAILTILDEGRGIPPEQLEEVFTPYRSHDKDGLPYQSPGLGLPLARRVLEAHGGSLRLISCEGGTAAVCSLPLCRELPTLLRSTAPHYLEDIFSPLYTILCDYITPPWPYPQP